MRLNVFTKLIIIILKYFNSNIYSLYKKRKKITPERVCRHQSDKNEMCLCKWRSHTWVRHTNYALLKSWKCHCFYILFLKRQSIPILANYLPLVLVVLIFLVGPVDISSHHPSYKIRKTNDADDVWKHISIGEILSRVMMNERQFASLKSEICRRRYNYGVICDINQITISRRKTRQEYNFKHKYQTEAKKLSEYIHTAWWYSNLIYIWL